MNYTYFDANSSVSCTIKLQKLLNTELHFEDSKLETVVPISTVKILITNCLK